MHTSRFPPNERFGITSQLRRAAVSAPTNIAEGPKRNSGKDYAHFLNVVKGSSSETEYLVLLSRELGYIEPEAADTLSCKISELLRVVPRPTQDCPAGR